MDFADSNEAVGKSSVAAATSVSSERLCFLRVAIAGVVQNEPIVIKLYDRICPKTCQNFEMLCEATSNPTYRNTIFHRIVDNFCVQGGDFENFDGTGGYSPLMMPSTRFLPDESFDVSHDRPGVVSMANRSRKGTGGSQFFITLKSCPFLDKRHVAFGQVTRGMDVVHEMTSVERDGDRPVALQKIVIVDCGVGDGDERRDANVVADQKKERKGMDQKKWKGKKHKKRTRTKRRRDSDEDSSSSSSVDSPSSQSSEEDSRHRTKRRKKHRKRSKGYDTDSSSSSSGDDRRRHKSRRKKKHRRR